MPNRLKALISYLIIATITTAALPPCVYADERINLALGKQYTKSVEPSEKYPDTQNKSTDGKKAGHYTDFKSYGYNIDKDGDSISVDVTINLSQEPVKISEVKVLRWKDYGADSVTVSTSTDGVNFVTQGKLDYAEGMWFDFNFPAAEAKLLKVNFFKKRKSPTSDWLFIDEIEVYKDNAAKTQPNLALKKTYKKSESPSAKYLDIGYESTDGIIANDYTDTRQYGYSIPKDGQTKSVDVSMFLSSRPIKISKVRVWIGEANYAPDIITVSTSTDNKTYNVVGSCAKPLDDKLEVAFPETEASYVKINFTKTRKGQFSDWLFINEKKFMMNRQKNRRTKMREQAAYLLQIC